MNSRIGIVNGGFMHCTSTPVIRSGASAGAARKRTSAPRSSESPVGDQAVVVDIHPRMLTGTAAAACATADVGAPQRRGVPQQFTARNEW